MGTSTSPKKDTVGERSGVSLRCQGICYSARCARPHTEAVEAPRSPLRLSDSGLSALGGLKSRFSTQHRDSQEHQMHATVRRYEGVDQSRTDELTKKVDETLLP